MSFLDDFWDWLKMKFEALWGDLEPILTDTAKTIVDAGGDLAVSLAKDAIAEIAADPTMLGNGDRLQAAGQKLLDKLKEQGIQIAIGAAVTVVQNVYNHLKANDTAPVNQPDAAPANG